MSAAERMAASVTRRCPAQRETKLPPRPTNTLTSPSRMAADRRRRVSRPCSRGGSKPNSSRSASRKASGSRSQMPMVRSPCTLEWPRTGHRPAPGLPMLPAAGSRLTISWTVATALRCWVMPIAQQAIERLGVGEHPRRARSRSRESPVGGEHLVPVERLEALAPSGSKSTVCLSDEVAVDAAPTPAAATMITCSSARSPPTRICRKRSASAVPRPDDAARRSAGCGSASARSRAAG